MEVQQNNPEVQYDELAEANKFLNKASKNNRGSSQEINWAIRNGLYSKNVLIDWLKIEMEWDYNYQTDNINHTLSKKLFDIVYGYSVDRIKYLYEGTYTFGDWHNNVYDNDYIDEFREILNYIWGFLRTVYNAYKRAHTINKHYKLIKYNFNNIRPKLINYIKNEYNPDYDELKKITYKYIEDFDNHNIYNECDVNKKENKVDNLYSNNSLDVDLYKNLIYKYKEIILEMVEEHNNNQ